MRSFNLKEYLKNPNRKVITRAGKDYDGDERALVSFCGKGFFSAVVDATEWLIKEGHFNKEYLV